MAKWDQKLDEIMKNELKNNKEVYALYNEIKKLLHGNTNINTEYVVKEIDNIYNTFQLHNSTISNISISPTYENETKENPENLTITFAFEGKFTGKMIFKTSSGYTTKNGHREDIYYVSDYDFKVESDLEKKVKEYYRGYLDLNTENFIDLIFDKDVYISYDSGFKTYELWDCEPGRYADSLTGYNKQQNDDYYKNAYKIHKNLIKIIQAEKIREFAENKLDGKRESVEWIEYKL